MSDKITSFPTLQPLALQSNGSFSPQGQGGGVGNDTEKKGFANSFTGDLYSSRGRFGNGNAYVDITAQEIKSANFVAGSTGWRIAYDGTAEFNSITIAGSGELNYGKTSFSDTVNAGYWFSADGMFIGNAGNTTHLKYTLATGALDYIGTLSNSAGTAVLDSGAVTILKDFTFSPSDYSGALKTGDITWNTTTGAITGGSGILINKSGIVGANAGVATFSINGTTGSAAFTGTITGSTITGGTLQTASSGKRITMTSGAMKTYDASDNVTFDLDSNSASQVLTIYTPSADARQGLFMHIDGTGLPLLIQVDNASNTNSALKIISSGSGSAINIDMNDADSVSPTFDINEGGYGQNFKFNNTRVDFLPDLIGTGTKGDITHYQGNIWTCSVAGSPGVWVPIEKKNFCYTTNFESLDGFWTSYGGNSTGTYDVSNGYVTLDLGTSTNTLYLRRNIDKTSILVWSKPRYVRWDWQFSSVDYHQHWAGGIGVVKADWQGAAQSQTGAYFSVTNNSGTNWTLYAVVDYGEGHAGQVSIGNNYFTADTTYKFEIMLYPKVGDVEGKTYFYINGSLVATITNPVAYDFNSGNSQIVLSIMGINTDTTSKKVYLPYWEFWQAI